jgi:hypothetical protein
MFLLFTCSTLPPDDPPCPSAAGSAFDSPVVLEGWQKFWEEPQPGQTLGIPPANIKWLKEGMEHGLYERVKPFKNSKGEVIVKRILHNKMEFYPPPIPSSIKGAVPNMLAFFTTPVFFWRPVGVMEVKISCPNSNCPAPPGSFLSRRGFSTSARHVCSTKNYYTLLTERLQCSHCEKLRLTAGGKADESGDEAEDDRPADAKQQYLWLASS